MQAPVTQVGAVLVTLTGGEITAVLVTCVCAWAPKTHKKNRNKKVADPARWRARSMVRSESIKKQKAFKRNKGVF